MSRIVEGHRTAPQAGLRQHGRRPGPTVSIRREEKTVEHLNTLTDLAPIIGGLLAVLAALIRLAVTLVQRHTPNVHRTTRRARRAQFRSLQLPPNDCKITAPRSWRILIAEADRAWVIHADEGPPRWSYRTGERQAGTAATDVGTDDTEAFRQAVPEIIDVLVQLLGQVKTGS
jgi:hypothetical protein